MIEVKIDEIKTDWVERLGMPLARFDSLIDTMAHEIPSTFLEMIESDGGCSADKLVVMVAKYCDSERELTILCMHLMNKFVHIRHDKDLFIGMVAGALLPKEKKEAAMKKARAVQASKRKKNGD